MSQFDEQSVISEVMAQCKGQQECKPVISVSNLPGEVYRNWEQLLFVEVACEQDAEMLQLKNSLGLLCTCLGLLVFLVFRFVLRREVELNKIYDRVFDLKLVTLADFSVKGQIESSIF